MLKLSDNFGVLGIDAGGTFTDLALVSEKDLSVIACAKTPTLREDMPATIRRGLDLILANISSDTIKSVSLATTFATNAIVENRTRTTALILMGYDKERVETAIKQNRFHTDKVLIVNGAHDTKGNETVPLDLESVKKWLPETVSQVEAIAVSGYFSVRNPSHELEVKNLINEFSPRTYVTCGHELASDLDAMLRAVTAALNADLIPVVMELLESVELVFKEKNIEVPISIVKSDGTLVGLEWAKLHPIETILSGPAASAVGARHLAKADKLASPSWVVDVGGTTTDIIYLDEKGHPELNPEGAKIGEHRTLIKTIDIYTFGLGGDSRVLPRDRYGMISVGPKRVRPICTEASEFPEITSEMKKLLDEKNLNVDEPLIINKGREIDAGNDLEAKVVASVNKTPLTANELIGEERFSRLWLTKIEEMEDKGLISLSGFTPTDALCVLGKLNKWDSKASRTAAAIITQKCEQADSFAKDVCRTVVHNIALNVLRKSFTRAGRPLKAGGETEKILSDTLLHKDLIGPRITPKLDGVIVGAGAPAWAFINEVGEALGTRALLPEYAEVTGAVGAAIGSFYLRHTVLLTPLGNGLIRAHLPSGIMDYENIDDAAKYTVEIMTPWMERRAATAGAAAAEINYERHDEIVTDGVGSVIHLWTQLIFCASNRLTERKK